MDSNVQKGFSFAESTGAYLRSMGHAVDPEYEVEVSINGVCKKTHRFDWGNESLLVECKAYNWTAGGNIPSAKLTTVNESLLYFLGTPNRFRKMLFISATGKRCTNNPETLARYYVRTHAHLIPKGVEINELDQDTLRAKPLWPVAPEREDESSHVQSVCHPGTILGYRTVTPVFHLKLWKTYYTQGFFNVPRAFDDLVGGEGVVTLVLRDNGDIKGHVNRTANRNRTARVIGGVRLRTWFQKRYSEGDTVPVRFDTPFRLRLG